MKYVLQCMIVMKTSTNDYANEEIYRKQII